MKDLDGLLVPDDVHERAKHWAQRSAIAGNLPPALLLALCAFLHAYQLRILFDDAPNITITTSRQVGKSFLLALRAVLQGLSEPERHQYLISKSQKQADSLMAKCKKWVRWIGKVLGRGDLLNKSGENNKSCITLCNDSEIRSLPSSPDSARGYTGDVMIDEAAFLPSADEMRDAAFGIASLAHYRKILASTPLGDRGLFYDYARGPLGKDWSHHTVTVHEAVRDGQDLPIAKLRAERTADAFAQEYECAFLSDAASYFPRELLEAGQATYAQIEAAIEREQELVMEWFAGVDIGRRHDLTGLCYGGRTSKGRILQERVDVQQKMAFDDQEEWLAGSFIGRRPSRVLVDETGLGMHLAENLRRRFPGTVYPANFSKQGFKRELVETTKMLLEQRRLGLDPDDRDTIGELNAIRRVVTKTAQISYTVDRTDDGHADRATALMLMALCAAQEHRGFFEDLGNSPRNLRELAEQDPFLADEVRARGPVRGMADVWERAQAQLGGGGFGSIEADTTWDEV